MRIVRIAAAGLTVAVIAAGATITAVGASRQTAFAKRAASLEQRWDTMLAEGVTGSALSPLRESLQHSEYMATWWSPEWWTKTGAAMLDDLQVRTDDVWAGAMHAARAQALAVIESWAQMLLQDQQYVPADAVTAERAWDTELLAADTPAGVMRLAGVWSGNIEVARHAAAFNRLNAEVASYGGVSGLLSQADAAVATAQRDNLDSGDVPAFTATLRTQLDHGTYATQSLQDLVTALQTLRTLISLNNDVSSVLRPLMLVVDQAGAEGTPNSQSFLTQYSSIRQAFRDAAQTSQLNAVAEQITTLQTTVNAELTSDQCGHNVGSGRVITLNLTLQEMVFYQDGCAVQAAPSTTGRQYLRTPTGTFHIFRKASPWTMVSPWPPGSPFWYPTGTVTWVMEFAGDGYFIHDAYWEPTWQYGPGSQDSSGASHGCVHIPTPVMQWAYSWTPLGTPVIITY